MIGLSVSGCVRDIAQGDVSIFDVEKIIAGTRVMDGDWSGVIEAYTKHYRWGEEEVDVLNWLLDNDMIEQPRAKDDHHFPNIAPSSGGRWVESEDDIVWQDAV